MNPFSYDEVDVSNKLQLISLSMIFFPIFFVVFSYYFYCSFILFSVYFVFTIISIFFIIIIIIIVIIIFIFIFFFIFIPIGNLTRKRECTNSMIVLRSDEALFFLLAHTNTDIVSAVCGALVNLSGDPGWRFLYRTAKGNNKSVHFYFNFFVIVE